MEELDELFEETYEIQDELDKLLFEANELEGAISIANTSKEISKLFAKHGLSLKFRIKLIDRIVNIIPENLSSFLLLRGIVLDEEPDDEISLN